jgi:murein DD-endopeptidase MepM/ murein hydrolase activator NlpD
VARQWWKKGRPRKPWRQKRGEARRALTLWVTRGVLAALFVVMTWLGSQFAELREYLRFVFVPGAAAGTPWSGWLDWQPREEAVVPVWVALTGRQDSLTFAWPVAHASYTAAEGGVYLASARGAAVQAVLAGAVAEVDEQLGQVTLDHGSGMRTVYRGLGELLVSQGDRVEVGHVLGRVGPSERLFFALSLANRLVDPTTRVRSP